MLHSTPREANSKTTTHELCFFIFNLILQLCNHPLVVLKLMMYYQNET